MRYDWPMARRSSPLSTLFGVAVAGAAAYYITQYALRTPALERKRVIAHRGGPRYAPENTLAAFAHGAAAGADMLECDVQMTDDGELIVLHDETLERTTNGFGPVATRLLGELRELDAGNGERIPTLHELIDLAKEAEVELLIELKSPSKYPGIEEKVIALLEDSGYLERTILQSFDWDSLRRLRQIKPTARLGALFELGTLDVSWPPADAEYVCVPAEMVLLNPGIIRTAHNEGRAVFAWFSGSETPLVYRYLNAFGVDGLIVDDPIAARRIL